MSNDSRTKEIQTNLEKNKEYWDGKDGRDKWKNTYKDGEQWRSIEWTEFVILKAFLGDLIPENPQWKILELAPGGGRNTTFLHPLASHMVLVDYSKACIDICKEKFGHHKNIEFYTNDGQSLDMVKHNDFDLIYCYDSLVHVDKDIIKGYVKQMAKMIKPSGYIYLHYSRKGASDYGWRSNMTHDLMKQYCEEFGLKIIRENFRIRPSDAHTVMQLK